jgi:hypothetical protein
MLKMLFYTSASILMLTLAYHLGARSARAQGSGLAVGVFGQVEVSAGAVVGRTIYRSGGGPAGAPSPPDPVPGTSPIIAICGDYPAAMLANGDLYTWNNGWTLRGNMVGAATPAAHPTFGQLKAQYRK